MSGLSSACGARGLLSGKLGFQETQVVRRLRRTRGIGYVCLYAFVAAVCVFGSVCRAFAQESPDDLLILFSENAPFNSMVDGKPLGASVEVVQAVLKRAGIRGTFQAYPWNRTYALSKIRPNTAIISLARLPEREQQFLWVGVVAPLSCSFYTSAKRTDVELTSLAQAKGYKIGTVQDDGRETFLANREFEIGRHLIRGTSSATNIKQLMSGQVDLVLLLDLTVPQHVRNSGYQMSDLRKVWQLRGFSEEGLYLCLSKASSPELKQKLRAALNEVKDSGEYAAIWSRYPQ